MVFAAIVSHLLSCSTSARRRPVAMPVATRRRGQAGSRRTSTANGSSSGTVTVTMYRTNPHPHFTLLCQ